MAQLQPTNLLKEQWDKRPGAARAMIRCARQWSNNIHQYSCSMVAVNNNPGLLGRWIQWVPPPSFLSWAQADWGRVWCQRWVNHQTTSRWKWLPAGSGKGVPRCLRGHSEGNTWRDFAQEPERLRDAWAQSPGCPAPTRLPPARGIYQPPSKAPGVSRAREEGRRPHQEELNPVPFKQPDLAPSFSAFTPGRWSSESPFWDSALLHRPRVSTDTELRYAIHITLAQKKSPGLNITIYLQT